MSTDVPEDKRLDDEQKAKYELSISNERRQFRIDVCPQQNTVPDDQWRTGSTYPPKDAQLQDLAQPHSPEARKLSQLLGLKLAESLEAAMNGSDSSASRKLARRSVSLRASRRQERPVAGRRHLEAAWRRLCMGAPSELDIAQSAALARDAFALLAVELLDAARSVGEVEELRRMRVLTVGESALAEPAERNVGGSSSPAVLAHGEKRRRRGSSDCVVPRGSSDGSQVGEPESVRQALAMRLAHVLDAHTSGGDVAASVQRRLQESQQPCGDTAAPSDYVANFTLAPHGLLGNAAVGDAVPPVLGISSTIPVNDEPFGDAFSSHLSQAATGAWRHRPNMRFCWALVLQPGAVRVCLLESDAIHVSAEMDLATVDGRRALANLYAGMCVSEPWRLGADPTMAWRGELGRWEIACGDEVGGVRVVYAEAWPFFSAESYFGRATRCFRVSLEPQGKLDHVLKDSWQLAPSGAADRRPPDEIDVLRTIRIKLEAAQSDVTYPRLVCGGTVHIATADDSDMTDTSALILGPFAQYSRWTVPHGYHGDRRQFHREHRRMVTTPIGLPIARLDKEHEVVAVLADAMRAHTEISRRCGILHRDISLNNILAVRLPGGRLRGMLIDYDHAIEAAAASNTARPGHVGTGPFMSIANLEGLHVPRTAADDWESLLCLLFCLAARREQSLEDMARDFMHVSRRGVAELKRHVFASPARLESAIRRYLDPGFAHVVRLIRALYTAIFQHPQCHGTAQIGLSSTRTIDPIKRRAMYAGEIQIRCMRAMEAAAADIANIQALHEHLAGAPQPQPPATSLCSQSTAQSTAESMASTLPPPPQSLSLADKPPVKDIARAIMHMNMRRNKRKADVSGCYQQSPKQKRRRLSTFSDVSMQSAIREDDEWPSPSPGKRSRAMRDLPEDPESPCPSKRLCFE